MDRRLRSEWRFAVVELGLSSDAFWRLTPGEFKELCEQWECREKRQVAFETRLTARICATLANTVRNPDKRPKPWSETDFMPKSQKQIDSAAAEGEGEWQAALAALAPYGVKERTNGRR